jgi:hypothetical protein
MNGPAAGGPCRRGFSAAATSHPRWCRSGARIGEDGTISVDIDTLIAKELHGNTDHEYTVSAEVRDESRRTIVGTGKVLVARKPFKIFSWVDRGYYRVGDVIQASFKAQTLDDKPVPARDHSLSSRSPTTRTASRWKLRCSGGISTPAKKGRPPQQIKATQKGQYRLSYKLTDSKKHLIEGGYLFTIVGQGFDGADFRFNNVELIPDKRNTTRRESQLAAQYGPGG